MSHIHMSKKMYDFATKLRQIDGLHLFKTFMKYSSYIPLNDINQLFNALATREKEADLRELEKLWNEFITTGDITIEGSRDEEE